MMRSLVFLGLVALAACGAPEQRVDTEGQAARAEMDTATAAFADCIEAQAGSMDVAGEPAGSLAIEAVKACGAERAARRRKSSARSGFPNCTERRAR